MFSQIGLYKGNVVAVKKLDKYHIQLEGHEHKELAYVRYFYIKHGNTDVQYIYAPNFEEGALVLAWPLWAFLHLRITKGIDNPRKKNFVLFIKGRGTIV